MMLAVAIGLLLLAGVIVIFTAQRQVYQNASSQSLVQDADNAISAVISPVARGAGFTGCSSINNGINSYIAAVAGSPLIFESTSAVQGYTGTMPTSITDGAANDTSAGDWTPALDNSLISANPAGAEKGSDVVAMLGAMPGKTAVGITSFGTSSLTVSDTSQLTTGSQAVAISDCNKSSMFVATAVNASSGVVSYTAGAGPTGTPLYGTGTQLMPIQQTVFFVGKGDGNQSALYRGVVTAGSNTWAVSEAIPGVDAMKVLYGAGSNGQATQYLDASKVTNWPAVTTIKLGFLIEGNLASSPIPSGPQSYTLFNTTFTMPADSRLRHVFYLTLNTRNNTL